MFEFLRNAGWGIYPVLLFGGIAFALAVRHAARPSRELQLLVRGFSVVTVLAGALGAATGVQHSARFIGEVPPDRRWIFLIGLDESLNNVVAAFVIVILALLVAMIGSYRLSVALALSRSMAEQPAK